MSSEPPPSRDPRQPPKNPWTVPVPTRPVPTGTAYPVPPAGQPDATLPPVPPDRTPPPGSNGLAIAALCCGLVGIFPLAALAAIVLGVVALSQLQRRIQRGRGMAIAGIVLGSLSLVAWVGFIIYVSNDEPVRDASGAVTQQAETFVDDLKAGDCFSYPGGPQDQVDLVTVIPCTSPHESQVVVIFELPEGPYPGEDKVIDAAEKGCTDKADPLLTDQAYEDLEPGLIYPDSYAWRGDRTIICTVEAPSGTTTGTALN
jgi:Domain of unknown function (DUF4190)/Septum formation